jgi:hypothetical protein
MDDLLFTLACVLVACAVGLGIPASYDARLDVALLLAVASVPIGAVGMFLATRRRR